MDTKKEKKSKELLEQKLSKAKIEENYSEITTIPLRLLSDLDDVNITSPSNNQQLKYNSTSKKWENFTP